MVTSGAHFGGIVIDDSGNVGRGQNTKGLWILPCKWKEIKEGFPGEEQREFTLVAGGSWSWPRFQDSGWQNPEQNSAHCESRRSSSFWALNCV